MTYEEFIHQLQINRPFLLTIAVRILKEESDAKDLLQDQIEEWIKSKEWTKVTTKFRSWFGGRISSRAKNVLRDRKINLSIEDILLLDTITNEKPRKSKYNKYLLSFTPNYLEPTIESLWDDLKRELEPIFTEQNSE